MSFRDDKRQSDSHVYISDALLSFVKNHITDSRKGFFSKHSNRKDQSRGHHNTDTKTQSPFKEGDHHSGGRSPHDLAGTHRQRQENPATPEATRRSPWQRHIPEWLPTPNANPVRRVSGGVVPLDETVPWPNAEGRSRMTTCVQLPSPRPLNAVGCGVPPTLGADFRLRAAVRTTPSRSAAPWCGEPSQCMAHTSVVSIASWHPPSRMKVLTDPTSGLPANPRLQCKTPAPQNPCP